MVKRYRQIVAFLFLIFLCPAFSIPVSSQVPEFRFKHLKVEDGLSHSTVRCILQDRMGFMWFGTNIGINKYDGREFVVYKFNPEDTLGLPANFISDIFEDSYGVLWVGTFSNGLSRLIREKDYFCNYAHDKNDPNSISSNQIRVVFEDSKKNLWIGTAGGGLILYNRANDNFTSLLNDSLSQKGIGSNYITGIAEDKNGFLWLASPEGILTKFNPVTRSGKIFHLYPYNVTDRMTTTFGKVYVDSEDNVWCGSEKGLFLYNQSNDKLTHFVKGNTNRHLNENAISDILELSNGLILISTDHGGLNIYDKKRGVFSYHIHSTNISASISNDQVYTIYRSPDGILWVGCYHGGVNIYDPHSKKFKNNTDLPLKDGKFTNGSVFTICEDSDKKIWFGYDGEGIDVYDPATQKVEQITTGKGISSIQSNSVVELYKSRNGDIWIGTYLKGLSIYRPSTGKFIHHQYDVRNPDGIGGNNVWSVFEDSRGYFWLGLHGNGVDRYDPKSGIFTHYRNNPQNPSSLINNDVYDFAEDKNGNIWVGTRNGLSMYDRVADGFVNYVSGSGKNNISGNCVYDICIGRDGALWIGTDHALNRFDPSTKTFSHFTEADGLSGSAVQSMIFDQYDMLWISTNKGLCRFDCKQEKFRKYDIADGLLNNEFNYVSVLGSSDGKIFFGSKSGFNFFMPDSVTDNPIIPPVYFTRLIVNNGLVNPRQHADILDKHINMEDEIKLSAHMSSFTLGFAALNFANSDKNQYAYKLEGFDEEWVFIGNKNEASYTNLNPGKYVLRVKGSNNDGRWNETGAMLRITILPPWWKTTAFRISLLLLIAGMLLMGYKMRTEFFRSQQRKLLVLVKERTFQLEEVAVALEEKQEEINSQNEKLMSQRDELEWNFKVLTEQQEKILDQNKELDMHRNRLESLIEERTRELIQAKNKAEESDKLKSSFLANLSHEIRTPLNAILGFSSLLGEKSLSDQEREEYNRIIQGSSNTLLELISDILDISKIEAGQLQLNMQEVSVEALLADVAGIFSMFMNREDLGLNKDVELRVNMGDEIRNLHIISDHLRLNQVLTNLINNAIKFTSQGFIEVGCSKVSNAEELEFYVKDTGIGVKEEHQELIFERFRKLEHDNKQLHRGTGLGLAISYQLVNLLGGVMWLRSKPGEGSTFFFTIPLISSLSDYKPKEKTKEPDEIPDYQKCTILVAEDDAANFLYIDKLLKKANANVLRAEDGKQAIEMVMSIPDIKIILMDIKMPVMDGIESLHEIRRRNIQIPVVAQTAYALAEEIVKLKKEGFDEYISKPIQHPILYGILNKYLMCAY